MKRALVSINLADDEDSVGTALDAILGTRDACEPAAGEAASAQPALAQPALAQPEARIYMAYAEQIGNFVGHVFTTRDAGRGERVHAVLGMHKVQLMRLLAHLRNTPDVPNHELTVPPTLAFALNLLQPDYRKEEWADFSGDYRAPAPVKTILSSGDLFDAHGTLYEDE